MSIFTDSLEAGASGLRGLFDSKYLLPFGAGMFALGTLHHPLHRMVTAAGMGVSGGTNPDATRSYLRNWGGSSVNAIVGGALGTQGIAVMGQQPGFAANVTSNGITPGITDTAQYSVNPDPDQALRSFENPGNPPGSIVFGLYNNRLK